MPEKKNQHFVPQSYFKQFNCGERFVSAYLVSQRKFLPSVSVADQSSKAWFYGDALTEDKVGEVESTLRGTLQELIARGAIDKRLKTGLLKYIAYQDARTSKKRDEALNAYRSIEAMTDLHRNTRNMTEARAWAANARLERFHADEKKWQWRFMVQSLQSSWAMEDLGCLLLENKSDHPFIFSDSPVALMNPHMAAFASQGVTGLASKGLLLVFPINPRYCALLFDADVYRIRAKYQLAFDRRTSVLSVDADDVKQVNTVQFFCAENSVYSGSLEALKPLAELTRPEKPADFVCAIDAVKDTADDYSIKIHGALNDLTEYPDLPFFEYKKSKRFLAARPLAQKRHRKKVAARMALVKTPEFLKRVANLDFDEMVETMDSLLRGDAA